MQECIPVRSPAAIRKCSAASKGTFASWHNSVPWFSCSLRKAARTGTGRGHNALSSVADPCWGTQFFSQGLFLLPTVMAWPLFRAVSSEGYRESSCIFFCVLCDRPWPSLWKKDSWIEKVDVGSVEMSWLAQVDTEQNRTEDGRRLVCSRHIIFRLNRLTLKVHFWSLVEMVRFRIYNDRVPVAMFLQNWVEKRRPPSQSAAGTS